MLLDKAKHAVSKVKTFIHDHEEDLVGFGIIAGSVAVVVGLMALEAYVNDNTPNYLVSLEDRDGNYLGTYAASKKQLREMISSQNEAALKAYEEKKAIEEVAEKEVAE